MFFAKTVVYSALLAAIARAAPLPEEFDDECWNGEEEPVPGAVDLPPSTASVLAPQLRFSSTFSIIPVASATVVASSTAQDAYAQHVSVPSVSAVAQASAKPEAAAQVKAPSASKAAAVAPVQSTTPNKKAPANAAASLSGQATFYGGNTQGGHCSFSTMTTIPAGLFGTAVANWDNSANCGACVAVKGPNGQTITAMVTDECPGCGTNHLDLYPDAFKKLADPSKGIIDVTWSYVDCPITAPFTLHNKSGVSAYWFSMQVVGASQAVSKLEVSTDNGKTWKAAQRQIDNFFTIPSGTGSTTVDVKVTSSSGNVVTTKNVKIVENASTTASGNF